MKRFVIRRNGILIGSYEGKDEGAALDAMAKDEGFPNFAACNETRGLVRDNYSVEIVKE